MNIRQIDLRLIVLCGGYFGRNLDQSFGTAQVDIFLVAGFMVFGLDFVGQITIRVVPRSELVFVNGIGTELVLCRNP